MIWVNAHISDKTCTAHKESCGFVLENETPFKGIGRELRDGGWYKYDSIEQAKQNSLKKYPALKFKSCGNCKP